MYLVFEGADGSGKGTQLNKLFHFIAKWMERERISVGPNLSILRQPGGTDLGQKVREMVKGEMKLDKRAVFHLFIADHFQFQSEYFANLKRAAISFLPIILQDRMTPISAWPYQVIMNEIPPREYQGIYNDSTYRRPDKTIILDIDANVLQKRIRERGERMDRFEKNKKFAAMANSYKTIEADANLNVNGVHINAALPIEEVFDGVVRQFVEVVQKYQDPRAKKFMRYWNSPDNFH